MRRNEVSCVVLAQLAVLALPAFGRAQYTSPRTAPAPTLVAGGKQPAPALFSPTTWGLDSITMTWGRPTGGTPSGYDVLLSATNAGPWVSLTTTQLPNTATTFTHKGLLPFTYYYYQVVARYPNGDWGTSGVQGTLTPRSPGVTNIQASVAKGDLRRLECHARLTWNAESGASGYYVVRFKEVITDQQVRATTYDDPVILAAFAPSAEYFVIPVYTTENFPSQGVSTTKEGGDPTSPWRLPVEVPTDCLPRR
jgi:hypothetical protein